jgi:uncharacterized membrane protein YphA (DoxX/SURF4 family)
MIAIGLFFRWALAIFFGGFLYLFLVEEPYYQNHYYLTLLFCVLLFTSRAGQVYSLDAWRKGEKNVLVPELDYWLLRFQMGTVYFFAGLAKLNGDWLRGRPLDLWLQGTWLDGFAVPVSLAGLLFDLGIVPLLLWSRTRTLAFIFAVCFHVTNHFLFHIGIFPFLAVAATLLFLDFDWPVRSAPTSEMIRPSRVSLGLVVIWCSVQLALPLRHWLYPGPVAWNLEGFQFSWMMRLNNRLASGDFEVELEGSRVTVSPDEYFTPFQAQIVRSDPNDILKFARILRRHFEGTGQTVKRVTANLTMNLNGSGARPFVDPEIDLSQEPYGVLVHNRWILPRN